jgi:hypothetical protein
MDKSKMPQRRGGIFGKRMFNIPFSVIIEFGSRTGILEFKTAFGGVVFGAASMSFEWSCVWLEIETRIAMNFRDETKMVCPCVFTITASASLDVVNHSFNRDIVGCSSH